MKRLALILIALLFLWSSACAEELPAEDQELLLADARYLLGITDLPEPDVWRGDYVKGGEDIHERVYFIEYVNTQGTRIVLIYVINDLFRDISVSWPDETEADTEIPELPYEELLAQYYACAERNPDHLGPIVANFEKYCYGLQLVQKPGASDMDYLHWIQVFGGDGSTIYDNTVVVIAWSPARDRIERGSVRLIR